MYFAAPDRNKVIRWDSVRYKRLIVLPYSVAGRQKVAQRITSKDAVRRRCTDFFQLLNKARKVLKRYAELHMVIGNVNTRNKQNK